MSTTAPTEAASSPAHGTEYRRSDVSSVPSRCLHVTLYNAETVQSYDLTQAQLTPADLPPQPPDQFLWLHFVGIEDTASLHALLGHYGIHPLVMEDILNHRQRPKVEDYGDYLFMAGRVFQYKNNKLVGDQVYMIFGTNWLMTFQRRPLGLFSVVRDRITNNIGHIRSKGLDFLAYTLIDRLIDDYFITIDQYNQQAEEIDKRLFSSNNQDILTRIHSMKRDATRLRRTLMPLRDSLSQLVRGDFAQFDRESHLFLRDAYDHAIQLLESLDAARDMVLGMMDVYLSFQSNQLNQQMRMLTVITIIFMPLTLISSIYGMNFEHMPELHWRYGYFMVLALMAAIAGSLLYFFYKRHWLK